MKRFHFAAGLMLALLASLVCVGPVSAGDPVSIHGILHGDYTVTPNPGTPTANLVVSASGIANHLGLFEVKIPHVVNFAAMSATGSYQFKALGGKLNGTFTGQSLPIGTDGAYVLVTENVTITGGTGRFANATGSFTTVRLVDRINLRTIGFFDGAISHPGHH